MTKTVRQRVRRIGIYLLMGMALTWLQPLVLTDLWANDLIPNRILNRLGLHSYAYGVLEGNGCFWEVTVMRRPGSLNVYATPFDTRSDAEATCEWHRTEEQLFIRHEPQYAGVLNDFHEPTWTRFQRDTPSIPQSGPFVNLELWREQVLGFPFPAVRGHCRSELTMESGAVKVSRRTWGMIAWGYGKDGFVYAPVFPGFILNTICYALVSLGALHALARVVRVIDQRAKRRLGGCEFCGYSRKGLPARTRCPECGKRPRLLAGTREQAGKIRQEGDPPA